MAPPPINIPYFVVLITHSWVRMIAIGSGLGATWSAWTASSPSSRWERIWGLLLTIALDVQILLGLLLYFFLSPSMTVVRHDFAVVWGNSWVRFFALDHVVLMTAAAVLVHVGRVLARRAPTPETRRARLRTCYGIALVLMIAGTPWPNSAPNRPLLRMWEVERD